MPSEWISYERALERRPHQLQPVQSPHVGGQLGVGGFSATGLHPHGTSLADRLILVWRSE
jgi:hypothetical protein